MRGTFSGIPIIRIIVYWGLYQGPLFRRNCPLKVLGRVTGLGAYGVNRGGTQVPTATAQVLYLPRKAHHHSWKNAHDQWFYVKVSATGHPVYTPTNASTELYTFTKTRNSMLRHLCYSPRSLYWSLKSHTKSTHLRSPQKKRQNKATPGLILG